MTEEPAETTRGRRQTVSLANLYLDPNNFRFADNTEYRAVAPEDMFRPDVQRITSRLVTGKSQEHVQDLIASIKENGWLDIDPILCRALGISKQDFNRSVREVVLFRETVRGLG